MGGGTNRDDAQKNKVAMRALKTSFRYLILLLATSVPVFQTTDAHASNPADGAKAASMANAFVAIADDPSAIYHNPAGLTFLRGTQIYGGISGVNISTKYESLSVVSAKSKPHTFMIPNIFTTSDFKQKEMVFGFGIFSPYGIGGRTYSTWGLTRYISTKSFIGTVAINPTFAWKPTSSFSFGIGIDYVFAKLDSKRMLDQSVLGAPDGRFESEGDGGGWGFNAGVLYTPSKKVSLGLAYRSRVDIKQCGTIKLEGIAPPLQPLFGSATFETDAETTLRFPDNISFGLAFRPIERWTIGIEVEWSDWSRFSKSRVDIKREIPAAGFTDVSINNSWRYQWYFKLGAEYMLNEGLYLRGGYLYSMSPVPDRTFSPDNPDSNQHNLAFGIGYKTGNITIDSFYNAGFNVDRKVSNSILSGNYKNFIHSFGINLGYHF